MKLQLKPKQDFFLDKLILKCVCKSKDASEEQDLFFFLLVMHKHVTRFTMVWCWFRDAEKHQPVKQSREPRIHAYVESSFISEIVL